MALGKLNLAPIGPDPKNVLDLGTGTGTWAIDFGKPTYKRTFIKV
jgi:ubiquinone/menaquinone biosynthesis C-methylase UbiE